LIRANPPSRRHRRSDHHRFDVRTRQKGIGAIEQVDEPFYLVFRLAALALQRFKEFFVLIGAGPGADRHAKPLIHLATEGALWTLINNRSLAAPSSDGDHEGRGRRRMR
jgi:hypothetical protein